jgi:FixJ family two-component response regulator
MTARPLILVVDDDDAARLSLQALLENSGYRVKAYAGGRPVLTRRTPGPDA